MQILRLFFAKKIPQTHSNSLEKGWGIPTYPKIFLLFKNVLVRKKPSLWSEVFF
jgi:hypothetical protein